MNPQQQQAVEAGDGPVAIIAGPGTGKTRTLVARIQFLIDHGVPANTILALTFTKKAAEEMAVRLSGAARPVILTFHALCFELLREKRGETPNFITEPARLALIKKLTKPTQYKGLSTRELSLLISRTKNMASSAADVVQLADTYNTALREQDLYDFDDLLLQTRDQLRADPVWRRAVQARFAHILVDEFQDTNALQYELLNLLRANSNVFVIGDPLQSIYGFRGADGDIFARFLREFGSAKTIVLGTNYRSASSIVNLTNAIFTNAPVLKAYSGETGNVQVVETFNEYSEAAWVLNEIQKAIGGSDLQQVISNDTRAPQRSLRDFAILYRSRHAARVMHRVIAASGLPFQVVGEGSPYDQPAVQAVIQVLAQLAGAGTAAAVPGFTTGQVRALTEKLSATQAPHKLAEHIVQAFGLPVDASMRQLFGVLVRFKTIQQATAYFDGIAAQGFYDPQADAITLLTIHAAKGLEFTHVFLIGAEEGILPGVRGDEAEEKRLFYVAASRPKERLDMVFTRRRGGEAATVSRFIAAISPAVLPRITDENLVKDQKIVQKRHAKRAQTSLF